MVAENHYRWDFIGLSTDTKPTPADSEKVTDGSTYYTSDDSKLYVWYKDQWYEKEVEGGGGGGTSYTAGDGIDITNHTISVDTDTIQEKLTAGTNITITDNVISATGGGSVTPVQTTGTSTTDVMSQNATTSMVFADPANRFRIQIGRSATTGENGSPIAIGAGAKATGTGAIYIGDRNGVGESTGYGSVAIGKQSKATAQGSVALGSASLSTTAGQFDIGTQDTYYGYNSTNYRLLTGVHDPVNAHDAATKGYVDSQAGGVTPVQTTGTSTTDVMSQNATSSMVFADPGTDTKVRIGDSASATGTSSVVIGQSATDNTSNKTVIIGFGAHAGTGKYDAVAIGNLANTASHSGVSIGRSATVGDNLQGGIALGAYSTVTRVGELNIGTSWSALGYNNTNYRVIGGVHDGQLAQDAVTVNQVNSVIDAINTALSTNIPHIGA